MSTCTIEGCSLKHKAKGFCTKHYERYRRYGDPLKGGVFREKNSGECKIKGCSHDSKARAMCHKHYSRWKKHGDPLFTKHSKEYGSGKDWYVGKDGYVLRWAGKDHPNATGGGNLYQHRDVMAKTIKRPLRNDENVHHKNGNRQDNRPENLELWIKGQPAGHRVTDRVLDAIETIDRYIDDVIKLGYSESVLNALAKAKLMRI